MVSHNPGRRGDPFGDGGRTGAENDGALRIGDAASGTQTVEVDATGSSSTLAVAGGASGGSSVSAGGVLTLVDGNGNAIVDSASSGSLTVGSGGTLSTSGTTNSTYFRVPITNQAGGTVTIGAKTTNQDSTTATSNSGTLQVEDGGHLALSGGSTLVDTAGGTIGVTGTFSTLSFGDNGYAVAYPSGAVQLTTEAVYTTKTTALSPTENVALTTPEVASIANDPDGTGRVPTRPLSTTATAAGRSRPA